ncbi:hypothetical protein EWM64_g8697 [Hericium alpestre]|uniref:F-box domain-containing protein n=1 Tax=Hericium alpestre TaxID=135208 RepID=A0A4Y9ZL14_9AGAM|nr:hypothetical protein EWM64_g8697 [Hericium alpestre]
MIPSLPSELIIKIIEHAYYLHIYGREADVKTLGACAMVCKQWSSCARKLLFFEVDLRSRGIPANSVFTNLEGPSTYTRSLKIKANRQPTTPDFIAVLSHFPALYHLDIFVESILELTELEVAQLVALPIKLRALTYYGRSMNVSRVLYQLMAVWPSIEFLHITSLGRLAPPPAERPPFSLYELATEYSGTLFPEPVLRWFLPPILAGQRGSINIMAITFPWGQAYDTLMEYAPYVRSLSLFCTRFPPQDFFERFGALEELTLSGFLTRQSRLNSESQCCHGQFSICGSME